MKPTITMTASVFGLLLSTVLASTAGAVVIASDNAADPAYAANPPDGAWQALNPGAGDNPPGTDNGGFGFLPWDFGGGFSSGGPPYEMFSHYIDGVDFPTTSFNNLGAPAFAIGTEPLPFFGITTIAQRPFAAPMQVGDIFSAEIDTPAQFDDYTEAGFPFAIIGFNDANGNEVFNIEAGSSVVYGDFPWRYDDLNHTNGDFGVDAGGTSIAPTATSDGATFSLEVLTPTTGRFTFDGVSLDITFGLIVGGTPTPAGPPASVFFTAFDNNGEEDDMGNPTGEHAFFFDNLQIDRPAAGLPGDYNGNNSVDAADYVLWRGGGPLQNEVATPGSVTPEDYDEWRARFGNSSPASGSSLGSPAGVPEPSALLLAACTALACFASRSVRRK